MTKGQLRGEPGSVHSLLHHRSVLDPGDNETKPKWAFSGLDTSQLPDGVQSIRFSLFDRDSEDMPRHDLSTLVDRIVLAELENPATREVLVALRSALRPGGRLVVIGRWSNEAFQLQAEENSLPSRYVFEVNLAEAGFRIIKEVNLEGDTAINRQEDGDSGSICYRAYVLSWDGYQVRCFQEGDQSGILSLFETSFFHQRSIDHWDWKYQQNPWGQNRISVIVKDGAEPDSSNVLGQYCAYPVPFLRLAEGSPERFLCHQVGDTMTAQTVRGVGRGPTSLLARSARHFYARFCHGQVGFNYGFNTGNIREFSKRFVGALEVEPMPYVVLREPLTRLDSLKKDENHGPSGVRGFLRSLAFKSRAGKSRGRRSRVSRNRTEVRIERTLQISSQLASQMDRLLEETLPDYRFLVERSSTYLSWRYFDAPDSDYRFYSAWCGGEFIGWSVFKEQSQQLLWGDALLRPGYAEVTSALLAEALAQAPEARNICGWFSNRPEWFSEQLSRIGFELEAEPDDLAMVVVPFLETDPAGLCRSELYFTMGDSDLF